MLNTEILRIILLREKTSALLNLLHAFATRHLKLSVVGHSVVNISPRVQEHHTRSYACAQSRPRCLGLPRTSKWLEADFLSRQQDREGNTRTHQSLRNVSRGDRRAAIRDESVERSRSSPRDRGPGTLESREHPLKGDRAW